MIQYSHHQSDRVGDNVTLLQKVEQAIEEIHAQYSTALSREQLFTQLSAHSNYPDVLRQLHPVLSHKLPEMWPELPLQTRELLSALNEPNEQPEPIQMLKHLIDAGMRPRTEPHTAWIDLVVKPHMRRLLGAKADRPEFNAWLMDVSNGKIGLDNEISARFCKVTVEYEGIHYRGEHGDPSHGIFQSKLSQYSFCTEQVARMYARSPNDKRMEIHTPRLITAQVILVTPFYIDDDPFVDMEKLRGLFDTEKEWVDFSISLSEFMENTDNFSEVMEEFGLEVCGSSEQLLRELIEKEGTDVLDRFYVDAFCVFDQPEIVERLKSRGYDGLAHDGMGNSAGDMEYKVLYKDQVRVESVMQITPQGYVPCTHYLAQKNGADLHLADVEQPKMRRS